MTAKRFVVERGSKGPEDKIIKVWSYGDVLTLEDILRSLDIIFRSEDSYYPKPKCMGSTMLMEAILEIYSNFPIEQVLRKFLLARKELKSVWMENLKTVPHDSSVTQSHKPITKLSEVLERE